MAIFLDRNDKVIVQGMTGSEGQKHTRRMLGAGTQIVAGTNPRKAGTSVDFEVEPIGWGKETRTAGTVSVPVYGTVAEAKEATGAEVSVIFVPPAFTKAAVVEAVDAGMRLVVVITEGVAVKDSA
ncbi:MAG: succinate--CoA ligase subunit alpha, partial [Arcanobacterium sp.]|nr:succinate--CoA ligase subunit alpha [Arcanobacterium sp.]